MQFSAQQRLICYNMIMKNGKEALRCRPCNDRFASSGAQANTIYSHSGCDIRQTIAAVRTAAARLLIPLAAQSVSTWQNDTCGRTIVLSAPDPSYYARIGKAVCAIPAESQRVQSAAPSALSIIRKISLIFRGSLMPRASSTRLFRSIA